MKTLVPLLSFCAALLVHGLSPAGSATSSGQAQARAGGPKLLVVIVVDQMRAQYHVAALQYTDQYLSAPAAERVRTDEALRGALLDALRALPGVQQAFYGPDLATAEARASRDPMIRAAALSYYPGRSGDLIVVPKRHWITSSAATTHGTMNDYDQRVPVILFGAGVKPGTYDEPATPADIAPTLGAAAGIDLGEVDGRVLAEAMPGDGQ
ncbi:MAG: hypothetical protein ACRD15_01580 [Vicinamibacterales bacterium]